MFEYNEHFHFTLITPKFQIQIFLFEYLMKKQKIKNLMQNTNKRSSVFRPQTIQEKQHVCSEIITDFKDWSNPTLTAGVLVLEFKRHWNRMTVMYVEMLISAKFAVVS